MLKLQTEKVLLWVLNETFSSFFKHSVITIELLFSDYEWKRIPRIPIYSECIHKENWVEKENPFKVKKTKDERVFLV